MNRVDVVELVDVDLDVDLVDVDLAASLCDGQRTVIFSFGLVPRLLFYLFLAPTSALFFGALTSVLFTLGPDLSFIYFWHRLQFYFP